MSFVDIRRRLASDPVRLAHGLTIAAFLASFLLSAPVWTSMRSYPPAPLFGLPAIAPPVDALLFTAMLIALVLTWTRARPALWVFFGLLFILGLFDQTRWQPWVLQEALLLAALLLPGADRRDRLQLARIVVAAVYVWSGFQKLNPEFLTSTFPQFLWFTMPWFPASSVQIPGLALSAALLEIVMGTLLLLAGTRWRLPAVLYGVLFHAAVLILIGPLNLGWNAVVWPWNLLLLLLLPVLLLLPDLPESPARAIARLVRRPVGCSVCAFVCVLPAFSFVGLWDSYPAFALYSGNTTMGVFLVARPELRGHLPPEARPFVYGNTLDFIGWAEHELGVVPYPEDRVFRALGRGLCEYLPEGNGSVLMIRPRRTLLWRPGDDVRVGCAELL